MIYSICFDVTRASCKRRVVALIPRTENRELIMKTGIIGLPQVGKTSLFRILTKANLSEQAYSNPREAHVGVAKVPDERLDKLAALYNPKKLTHASVEYV